MAFYYKGRYLGETPKAAYDNLSRKETSDIVFDYLMRWSSMDDMARMIAEDSTGGSEFWAMSALKSTREDTERKGPHPIQSVAGLVWRDGNQAGSKPKASANRRPKTAPAKKAGKTTARRR